MTLKELQQSIADTSKQRDPPKEAAKPVPSLKELQRKMIGISFGEEDNAVQKKESLEEIQRKTSLHGIRDPEDIRMIFKNTLRRSLADMEACVSGSMGSILKTFQDENANASVAAEDITLLDIWVMIDWCSINIQKYTFMKKIMTDLQNLAKHDIWFGNLLKISINSLKEFPDFSLDNKSRVNLSREIDRSFLAVFGKRIGDTVTIGGTLSKLQEKLSKAWWVDTDINKYKKEIISCGRLISSIIHLMCAGYADIEARVSENDYPFRQLKELLNDSCQYDGNGSISK